MTTRTADLLLGSGLLASVAFVIFGWLHILAMVMP